MDISKTKKPLKISFPLESDTFKHRYRNKETYSTFDRNGDRVALLGLEGVGHHQDGIGAVHFVVADATEAKLEFYLGGVDQFLLDDFGVYI